VKKQHSWTALLGLIVAAGILTTACPGPENSGGSVYQVHIAELSYGTITAQPDSGPEGTEISLTIEAAHGYRLNAGTLKYNNGSTETRINSSTKKFTLPPADVTVSAEFEEFYRASMAEAARRFVSLSPPGGPPGTEISVTFLPETQGYRLKPNSLFYRDGETTLPINMGTLTFLLPTADITVYAEFEEITLNLFRKMIRVPGGTVRASIGNILTITHPVPAPFVNAREIPVAVDAFSIGAYEVCYELWWTVKTWATGPALGINRYTFDHGQEGVAGNENRSEPTPENKYHPVVYISWLDALVWCNAYSEWERDVKGNVQFEPVYYKTDGTVLRSANLSGSVAVQFAAIASPDLTRHGYRLPLYTEWEFAARGGNPSALAWSYTYAGSNILDEVGWYQGNSGLKTHTAGTKLPNALNLYDITGNARELVAESYARSNDAFCIALGGYVTDTADAMGLNERSQSAFNTPSMHLGFRVAGPASIGEAP
jgi:formylglycine-generating enzyme required for sulfatase activity